MAPTDTTTGVINKKILQKMRQATFYDIISAAKAACLGIALTAAATAFATASADNQYPTTAEQLKQTAGIDLSYDTFKKYITTGLPQDERSKILVVYNVGTGKFLTLGGYWGTHAMLSDVPHMFWLQRRNEEKAEQNTYVRYPETPEETVQGVYANNYISNITDLTKLQVGAQEDKTSHAKYNYARLVNKDGTYSNILEEGYEPNGNKIGPKEIDFNGNTQRIEMEIDLSGCSDKEEDIIVFGNDITKWGSESAGIYNLHLYYTKGKTEKQLDIEYVDKSIPGGTKIFQTIDSSQPMTLVLSKEGLRVNGVLQLAVSHTPEIEYNEELAGDIVRFKTDENGQFVTDANGCYIIDQENGKGLLTQQSAYTYSYSSKSEKTQTYFLASRFTKANPSANEGNFLGRTLYDSSLQNVYGTIGIYGDRKIATGNRENSQWSIDKVDGEEGNVYTISLTFTKGHTFPEEVADKSVSNGFRVDNTALAEDKQLFLQATNDMVKSGNLNDEYNGNYFNDPDGTNTTFDYAEALEAKPDATNKYAYWKILTLDEYYRMLQSKQSSSQQDHANLSFILADNSFDKENSSLMRWQIDGMYPNIKFGIDNFYKTLPSETEYTNEWGSMGEANKHLNTLSRYFGVMAYNGARGRLYQDLDIYQPGWYTLTCGGMSNAGAKLFVEKGNAAKDSNGDDIFSTPITTPLTTITDEELEQLSGTVMGWPYREGMPMYNALVDINDEQIGEKEKYTNSLRFFVGNATSSAPVRIRFGIYIVDEDTPTTGDVPGSDLLTVSQPRKTAAEKEFTVFDNFQLLYDGQSEMPNLVLSEDFTDLDYIENAGYEYDLQPLHLKRTFTPNAWNTIVLPVDLSESQVKAAFGENTRLARLHSLTDNSVRFVYVEPNDVSGSYLRAYQPYLIKPEVKEGSQTAYSVELTMNDETKKTVSIPANHFDIGYVTLAGKTYDQSGTTNYPISTIYNSYIVSQTAKGTNSYGTMTAKGTLCKTFEEKSQDEGGNSQGYAIINGRPDLKDCGAYIMRENVMYRVPDGQEYGMRGLRCWFEYNTSTSEAAPTSMRVDINGIQDDTNTIDDIQNAGEAMAKGKYSNGVFTINGVKLNATDASQLPSGLYIVNGRKVMVR